MMRRERRAALKRGLAACAEFADLKDLLSIAGAGMVFHGLSLVHLPSAFVVTGGLLIVVAVVAAVRRTGSDPEG